MVFDVLLSTGCSLSLEDYSMAKSRLDIDRVTNSDEPDHVVKLQNQDSFLKLQAQDEKPPLDTTDEKVKNQDSSPECNLEPDDLFHGPVDLFGHLLQVRTTKLVEKLKICKLDDDKEKWDAKRQLQKDEQKKRRDEEKKRRDEVKNKLKDKGKKNKKDKGKN